MDSHHKIVLVSAEVERLNKEMTVKTKEVETYRTEIIKIQSVQNNQAQLDKLNRLVSEKEGEIQKLRAAITQLENQLGLVVAENERLNFELRDTENEVEGVRGSYYKAQSIKGRINELESKITFLTSENERLKEFAQDKAREADVLKAKIMRGSVGIDITNAKNQVIQNLQMRIVLLNAEVERLSGGQMKGQVLEGQSSSRTYNKY